jgi:hypothetical protein
MMAAKGEEIFDLSLTKKAICLAFYHAVDDYLSKI